MDGESVELSEILKDDTARLYVGLGTASSLRLTGNPWRGLGSFEILARTGDRYWRLEGATFLGVGDIDEWRRRYVRQYRLPASALDAVIWMRARLWTQAAHLENKPPHRRDQLERRLKQLELMETKVSERLAALRTTKPLVNYATSLQSKFRSSHNRLSENIAERRATAGGTLVFATVTAEDEMMIGDVSYVPFEKPQWRPRHPTRVHNVISVHMERGRVHVGSIEARRADAIVSNLRRGSFYHPDAREALIASASRMFHEAASRLNASATYDPVLEGRFYKSLDRARQLQSKTRIALSRVSRFKIQQSIRSLGERQRVVLERLDRLARLDPQTTKRPPVTIELSG
jgi:hypothetical protein